MNSCLLRNSNKFFFSKAKRYREMFSQEIGNKTIKTIYEKSEINKNKSLLSLCEDLLETIENNSEI